MTDNQQARRRTTEASRYRWMIVAAISLSASPWGFALPVFQRPVSEESGWSETAISRAMAGSLGMAAGPLGGGMIYDATFSYRWLNIRSWGIRLIEI